VAGGRGVVVGTDGSPASQNAVRWAAREAALRNAPLTILHAARSPEWEQEGRRVLQDGEQLALACVGAPLPVLIEMSAEPAVHALVAASREADIVVVGLRRDSPMQRLTMGSTVVDILRHSHSPIAVVHDNHSVTDVDVHAPVLVGVALDQTFNGALDTAFEEAALRDVDVVALHCCRASNETDPIEASALRTAIEQRVHPWRTRFGRVGVRIAAVHGEPLRHLVEFPAEPQLIVVGRRTRRTIASRVHGSTSLGALRAAGVPVVVVRDEAASHR
jgi:nucleotide-binding universal stress UspA family protein